MHISDLPKHFQLQLYLELKILGVPVPDPENDFPDEIKEVAKVSEFRFYAKEMGLSDEEFAEIRKIRSEIARIEPEDPERLTWVAAQAIAKQDRKLIVFVERRGAEAQAEIRYLEEQIKDRGDNFMALERLQYYRLLSWYIIRFLRLYKGGEKFGGLSDSAITSSLTQDQIFSHEIAARDKKILELRAEVQKARRRSRKKPSKEDLKIIIDKHRFRTGRVNYSAVGTEYGCTGETIKRWVEGYNLLSYAEPESIKD